MRKINPGALLGIGLGVSGLIIASGKKPPDFLLVAGLLAGIVGVAIDVGRLVEGKDEKKEKINVKKGNFIIP